MSRRNDALASLVFGWMVTSWLRDHLGWFQREEWWKPEKTDKGGRGAGPGASSAPVPQGAANVWSENTMRVFSEQMRGAGIDAHLALLGIAAASNFNADQMLGNNTGLMLVRRQDLSDVGYPGVPPFEETDAVHQIPWIARVIGYRISSTGGRAPKDVGELAVLLNPVSNPSITEVIRAQALKQAAAAEGTSIYLHHKALLQHVLSNP